MRAGKRLAADIDCTDGVAKRGVIPIDCCAVLALGLNETPDNLGEEGSIATARLQHAQRREPASPDTVASEIEDQGDNLRPRKHRPNRFDCMGILP